MSRPDPIKRTDFAYFCRASARGITTPAPTKEQANWADIHSSWSGHFLDIFNSRAEKLEEISAVPM